MPGHVIAADLSRARCPTCSGRVYVQNIFVLHTTNKYFFSCACMNLSCAGKQMLEVTKRDYDNVNSL